MAYKKRIQQKAKPPKLHVKRGDRVKVIAGEWKGSEGVIKVANRVTHRVTVEGVNMITKTRRKSQQHPDGGMIETEGSIHVSNVKLVEAAD